MFLALAPFMPKPRLVGIFGRNLLDDPAQTAGYDALLEFQDHKPFECVGEGRESRAAMAALATRPEWREDALVERFAARSVRSSTPATCGSSRCSSLDDEHGIPAAPVDPPACASRSLTASASRSGAGAAKAAPRIARCAHDCRSCR